MRPHLQTKLFLENRTVSQRWQWIWSENRTSQSITLSYFLSTTHKHVWCFNIPSPEWVQKGPCSSGVVLLSEVHQRRERQHGHTDEQHQQAQLLVRLEEHKFPRAVIVGYFVSVWNCLLIVQKERCRIFINQTTIPFGTVSCAPQKRATLYNHAQLWLVHLIRPWKLHNLTWWIRLHHSWSSAT